MVKLKNALLYASLFINMMLVFLWAFESRIAELPVWVRVIGRLHPAFLHFPITLLLLVAFFELLFRKFEQAKPAVDIMITLAAFSSSLAAICGFFLMYGGGYENSNDLYWHKITGIMTALLAGSLFWLRTNLKAIYIPALLIGCALLVVAGHLGSTVTHGKDFLTEPLLSKKTKITDVNEAVVYGDIIQSILDEKCVGCHNPNKQKGELLLTDFASLQKGGKNGAVVIPGSIDSSSLYQLLLLPADDDRHMPPEGKPQPDEDEIQLIRWWIAAGAHENKKVIELTPPDSVMKVLQRKYGPGSPLDDLRIEFASVQTINSLNNNDRGVRQLSMDKPYVSVFMANRKGIDDKEFDELTAISKQVISFDLSSSSVSPAQIARLAKFPHIQRLHLENSTINDSSIAALEKLKYLNYLNISNTGVTAKALAQLDKIKKLDKLFIYETTIDNAQVSAFRSSHPKIFVGYTPDLSLDSSYRGRLTDPVVKIDSNMFLNHATVEISYRLKGVNIHYTLDGSDPDSSSGIYDRPISVDRTGTLKVRAIRDGWEPSKVLTYQFEKAKHKFLSAKLDMAPDKRYQAKLDTTLVDFTRGTSNHADGNYVGFEGNNLDVLLDLGKTTEISSIGISYISNHPAFVLAPVSAEAWSSDATGKLLKKLGRVSMREGSMKNMPVQGLLELRFSSQQLQYIKLKIGNAGKTPTWHPSPGAKCWLFVDEIIAN